jgi:hypothetical protein
MPNNLQTMKSFSLIFLIALAPILATCQTTQACPEFSPWEKLMRKENYEEAARIAKMINDRDKPDSWEKKDLKIYEAYKDKFTYDKNYLCGRNNMSEPYRLMGNLRKAVEIFSNYYKDNFAGDEGFLLHRYIHYCIELGEKQLAQGNLDLALEPLLWAAKVGQLKVGDCSGYPNEQTKKTHPFVLTELLGDVWLKKENYVTALKYYELFDTSKYSNQIITKINTAKSALGSAKTNAAEIENQTKLQIQKDEAELPVTFSSAKKRTAGLIASGNISIKINSANEVLAQKKIEQWESNDLAFNLTGEELYFKNYVDSVYMLWDVKNKVKLSEIPFADIDKTSKGRAVAASFFSLYIYTPPVKGKLDKWISADMQLSITNQELFAIKNEKGEQIHSFLLPREVDSFWINQVNIQAYFHVSLNKLFIFRLEENIKKEFESSFGVFVYDLNKKQVLSLYKKKTYSPNASKWSLNNNKLMHQVVSTNTDFFVEGIRTYNLAVLKGEELTYDFQTKLKHYYGITNKLYIGSDLANHDYFKDYIYNGGYNIHIKYGLDRISAVVSLFPTSSSGNLNSLKVDPTGNYFAYYEVFFQPNVGNFVSINVYDVNQPNQIYTLTDQTKYPVLLGKNYVTSKENSDFLLDRSVAKAKADNKLREDLAKVESEKIRLKAEEQTKKDLAAKEAALLLDQKKEKNRQLYKKEYDSLQLELKKVREEIQENFDRDVELFKQKNYRQILKSRKWEFTVQFQKSLKYSDQYLAKSYKMTIKNELEFKDNGPQSLDIICNSTYTVPAVMYNYGDKSDKSDVLDASRSAYANSIYKYYTLNSTNNSFKIDQNSFPMGIKPLSSKPFTDKDEELNSIRAKWVLDEELYIRKRSFLLRMNPGAQIELVLLEADGSSYRTIEPIYSDHEYEIKNKSRDLISLINNLENR